MLLVTKLRTLGVTTYQACYVLQLLECETVICCLNHWPVTVPALPQHCLQCHDVIFLMHTPAGYQHAVDKVTTWQHSSMLAITLVLQLLQGTIGESTHKLSLVYWTWAVQYYPGHTRASHCEPGGPAVISHTLA